MLLHRTKHILFILMRWILIIGISYIILGPIISIVSLSFKSVADVYNPLVYVIPAEPTWSHLSMAFTQIKYIKTMGITFGYVLSLMAIQTLVTAMVGYGFARFNFPFKNLLFGCVVLTIVIPTHSIMVPLYTQFRFFDLFGVLGAMKGTKGISLLGGFVPMFLLTVTGVGLRSGLYIYIFRQFFRGLPKEIEESARIDGAGMFKTFFAIMLPNAVPSIVTVLLFSLVWQYNDTFYASLFTPSADLISLKITTLASNLATVGRIYDPRVVDVIVNGAVLLTILPVIIIYLFLQRYFMEGIERSGIVG